MSLAAVDRFETHPISLRENSITWSHDGHVISPITISQYRVSPNSHGNELPGRETIMLSKPDLYCGMLVTYTESGRLAQFSLLQFSECLTPLAMISSRSYMFSRAVLGAMLVGFPLGARADREFLAEAAQQAAVAMRNWRRDSPSEVRAQQEALCAEREALRTALEAQLRNIGQNATRDQIDQVVVQFKREHAEEIAEQNRLSQELTQALKQSVLDDVPNAVVEFRVQRKALEQERRDARRHFVEQVNLLQSKEAQKELRDAFRDDQRARHRELKEALKLIRAEIRREGGAGDRRIAE